MRLSNASNSLDIRCAFLFMIEESSSYKATSFVLDLVHSGTNPHVSRAPVDLVQVPGHHFLDSYHPNQDDYNVDLSMVSPTCLLVDLAKTSMRYCYRLDIVMTNVAVLTPNDPFTSHID
jgi:hypothetical protein